MTELDRSTPLRLTSNAGKLLASQTIQHLFQTMSPADYVLMWMLAKHTHDTGSEKFYLKDLAQELQLPMPQVSKIAKNLQSKGLVLWTHDGLGQEGTYLQLTESAMDCALEQRQRLAGFIHHVVEEFGQERFVRLLGDIVQLEEIMNQQAQEEGGPHAVEP